MEFSKTIYPTRFQSKNVPCLYICNRERALASSFTFSKYSSQGKNYHCRTSGQFRRLTFDLACQLGFGFDPEYLLPSLPATPFADAYETAVKICIRRVNTLPLIWKATKKLFNTGQPSDAWGSDWADFRPERWLEKSAGNTGRNFTYPVFQAGPRTCLGKDIAIMQMKMVVTTVLKRFRVLPAEDNFSPNYDASMTSKMKGGFPVRILERH
ncbi:cytochrome P450 94C1-like [Nicotiana sylvestris]|uniref:cytochrome P450 94C1-like n=1 Tax=Nicotiana sylvestris TaxID=4096 RepID=UPI00388CAC61